MTCVIGLVEKGKMYLGADSASIGGNFELVVRNDPKVFKHGEFLVGYSQSPRLGQILRFGFKYPAFKTQDGLAYLVQSFMPRLITAIQSNGFTMDEDHDRLGCYPFLIMLHGRLFRVESDFQVVIRDQNYDAIGCASDVALGAMYASPHLLPRDRIYLALEAASKFSVAVTKPFRMVTLDGEEILE